MNLQKNYDIAIIGAGIGGLTAASLLCKCGLSVALIEKEPHSGGYLAGFQHRGYRFDTAIHWLNQCSETGFVTKIFKLIGSDHPVCKSHKKIQRYKGDTLDFLLTQNPDDLQNELIKLFPDDVGGINNFFKAAKKLGKSFNHFSKIFRSSETMSFIEKLKHNWNLLKFAIPFIPYISYTDEKMKKGLQKFFINEALKEIFSAETDLLSCLVPIGWAYYGDYQHPPEGGGQVIPEWMVHVLKQHGCDVHFNTTAKQILLEGNTAKGLQLHHKGKEKTIHAEYIIAACDLATVYNQLLPHGTITAERIKRLNDAEIYASSFTVSIALDCPTEQLGFGEEMIHLFKENIAKELHNSGDPDLSALTILAPSVTDKSLAPQGCGTLVIFMPAYMNQYNNWQTGEGFERGAGYYDLKKSIAEKLIDRLQQSMAPALKEHIVFYDVATPVTHWRYTGNKFGTMMGAKPGKKNMQAKVAGYKTPVKNLLIGGQWAELGGGVPIATKAGTNAALLILKKQKRKAFDELVKYFEGKRTLEEIDGQRIFAQYDNSFERKKTVAEKYFKT